MGERRNGWKKEKIKGKLEKTELSANKKKTHPKTYEIPLQQCLEGDL